MSAGDGSIEQELRLKDRSSEDLVEILPASPPAADAAKPPLEVTAGGSPDEGAAAGPSGTTAPQAEAFRLLWSKSKVYVHPTAYLRDNIPGFLGLLRHKQKSNAVHLAWIPESLLDSSNSEDRDVWVKVELDDDGKDHLVRLPVDSDGGVEARSHAFSLPISSIYSLIVRPPTLSSWHGSVVVNMFGGVSLPTLYFHDDESRSTLLSRDARASVLASVPKSRANGNLPASWGGEALLSQLRRFSDVFPSQIEPSLFLINPNREDRDAHCTPTFDDDVILNPVPLHQRPHGGERNSILHQSLNGGVDDRAAPSDFTFNLLNSFSKISRKYGASRLPPETAGRLLLLSARSAAQSVLTHKLARPIIPHLPEPIASLANANQPEFVRWSQQAGTEGYDVARVYLARWSQIVAAEGERSRRTEFGIQPGEGEDGVLGAFELLEATYHIPQPRSDRAPTQPIQLEEWNAWFSDDGTLLLREAEGRKRIFQRGLAPAARKAAWPFLLRVYPWSSTAAERERYDETMREDYARLKANWVDGSALQATETFVEESHRIEIDCRRTDRTQPIFVADPKASAQAEPSNMPPTNDHVIALGEILMTYNTWERDLGYVQGMSDLCAPLYIVFDADQATTFWCFSKLMDRMKSHFLRDQSGMKNKLSLLQQLLVLMDPQLHAHLERASSLNLFFCFRWILIHFKREFAFDDVLKVWEAIWTDVCGPHTDLFLALAVLEANRDVIIRYLREFDEVLRFVHDVAGSLDVDSLLSQTQVLWLTFESIALKATEDTHAQAPAEGQDGARFPEELRALLP